MHTRCHSISLQHRTGTEFRVSDQTGSILDSQITKIIHEQLGIHPKQGPGLAQEDTRNTSPFLLPPLYLQTLRTPAASEHLSAQHLHISGTAQGQRIASVLKDQGGFKMEAKA